MDIVLNRTETDEQYLEFNTLGGIVDLYILAGDTPIETAKQYAQVVGMPLSVPYWYVAVCLCMFRSDVLLQVVRLPQLPIWSVRTFSVVTTRSRML